MAEELNNLDISQHIDETLHNMGVADLVGERLQERITWRAESLVRGDIENALPLNYIGSEDYGFIAIAENIQASEYPDFANMFDGKKELSAHHFHFLPEGTENKSSIMIMGMKGVLTYLTLIEGGYIDKPEIVFGDTNPTMAKVAARLGLQGLNIVKRHGNKSYLYPALKFENAGARDVMAIGSTYEEFRDDFLDLYKTTGHKLLDRDSRKLAAKP